MASRATCGRLLGTMVEQVGSKRLVDEPAREEATLEKVKNAIYQFYNRDLSPAISMKKRPIAI